MRFQIKLPALIKTFFLFVLCAPGVFAQANAVYDLSHNVIATGGDKSSNALNKVEGTVGQSVAGTTSTGTNAGTNTQYALRGGFWAFEDLAPTAATVSVAGRITGNQPNDFGKRVTIVLINLSTGATRTAQANSFGYYQFDELEIGELYLVRAHGKTLQMTPDSYLFTLTEGREDLNFTAVSLQ